MWKSGLIGALSALLAMAFPTGAVADPMQDAKTACNEGDYASALGLYRPLAERGAADAQYGLGAMFYRGQGVARDFGEALHWFRLAAEQGHADACNSLGVMYYEGSGTPKNAGEAFKWFRLAAEQGRAAAQYMVGIMYFNGTGTSQDFVNAYKWVTLAASGYATKEQKDNAVRAGRSIAKGMTSDQINEARRLALQWKPAK